MIVGIGLDIVDTERLARALAAPGGFEERVFTRGELESCATRADRIQALAARFAAKEACMKALGVGILETPLREVEIVSGPTGAPQLQLAGTPGARARTLGVRNAHVSLTHEPGLAAAVVILEGTRTRAVSRPERRLLAGAWTVETLLTGTW
jgi:holo-[acyl-carrier protein] synthase